MVNRNSNSWIYKTIHKKPISLKGQIES
uniref:Uncharacterized protein n=1 Tax=Rhizophora mucronata TaxID=61149 RepID=A0A2P2M7Q8_RHIMU